MNGVVLNLSGDGKSDKLAIRLAAGVPTLLEVDVKNDGTPDFTFDRSTFTAISISAGAGNDTVLIDESNGQFTDESVVIDGGAGNDSLTGGSGPDVIIAGDGGDFVNPRRGQDLALLGAGDDSVVWVPGDGSDVIEGQDGDDRLAFTGSNAGEMFELAANGGRVVLFRDVASIVMDLNDVEQLDLPTLGGVDTVTVNDLAGTDLVRVNVDLAGAADPDAGDSQADSVVVNGTAGADVVSVGVTKGVLEVAGLAVSVRVAHADPTVDRVGYGVAGADDVHLLGTPKPDVIGIASSPAVTGLRATVDGFPAPLDVSGGGQLTVFGLGGGDTIAATGGIAGLGVALELDGGAGNDSLTGGNGAEVIIGGTGKDVVRGGPGNDVLFLGSGSDTAIWQPGDGSDTVEGQTGTDTLDFRGAAASEIYELSPNGGRLRLTRNVGAITMDADDVERVTLSALGGADTITVNDLTGTDVKKVTLDLEGLPDSGTGDAALDAVVVNGTAAVDKMRVSISGPDAVLVSRKGGSVLIEHPEPTDTLTVNGLAGEDQILVGPRVPPRIAVTVNPD